MDKRVDYSYQAVGCEIWGKAFGTDNPVTIDFEVKVASDSRTPAVGFSGEDVERRFVVWFSSHNDLSELVFQLNEEDFSSSCFVTNRENVDRGNCEYHEVGNFELESFRVNLKIFSHDSIEVRLNRVSDSTAITAFAYSTGLRISENYRLSLGSEVCTTFKKESSKRISIPQGYSYSKLRDSHGLKWTRLPSHSSSLGAGVLQKGFIDGPVAILKESIVAKTPETSQHSLEYTENIGDSRGRKKLEKPQYERVIPQNSREKFGFVRTPPNEHDVENANSWSHEDEGKGEREISRELSRRQRNQLSRGGFELVCVIFLVIVFSLTLIVVLVNLFN